MLVESAGHVPLALGAEDYVELLPATWRAVNAYGIKVNNRTYDADALDPLRLQPSGITRRRNLWEVHHDPYDASRIWVRDHHAGRWITATWTHLHRVAAPFGELAWDHVRHTLPKATEAELAQAVDALLTRAHQGPPTDHAARDRRVAARTRATTPLSNTPDPGPTPPAEPGPAPVRDSHDENAEGAEPAEQDPPLAKVIPLGLFDPLEDPWKKPRPR